MEFLKNFFSDNRSVTGLCDLKRKVDVGVYTSSEKRQAPEISTPVMQTQFSYCFEPYFNNKNYPQNKVFLF